MELLSSAFDGKYFCFKFWDDDANTLQMKVYDQQGEEVVSNVENTKYAPTNKNNYFYQAVNPELSVIENGGFINYSFHGDDKGFFVNYADGNTKRTWSKAYEPANKYKIMQPAFIGGNQSMVLTAVSIVGKGDNGAKGGNFLLASDPKDGSVLFDISTDIQGNFIMPVNAVIEDDKISIIGLSFPVYSSLTATPEGIGFVELDKKGKILKSVVKSFDETIGKFQRLDNHKFSDGNFPFVHQIVRTSNGNTLLLIEKFKSAVMNGLTLGNFILIELNKNYEFIQGKEFSKEIGKAPSVPFFGSYFSANIAKMNGALDYLYMQKNDDNTEITFSFYETEEKAVKGVFRPKSFDQIKYKNGKITSDKAPLRSDANDEATATFFLPAKTGYFLEANYFKKKKELSMDFIKLNN